MWIKLCYFFILQNLCIKQGHKGGVKISSSYFIISTVDILHHCTQLKTQMNHLNIDSHWNASITLLKLSKLENFPKTFKTERPWMKMEARKWWQAGEVRKRRLCGNRKSKKVQSLQWNNSLWWLFKNHLYVLATALWKHISLPDKI